MDKTQKNKEKDGVIIYLCRNMDYDKRCLASSLDLLRINFNEKYSYPIVIFHEDLDEESRRKISARAQMPIIFEKIEFLVPDFLDPVDVPEVLKVESCDRPFPLGYRHMCRFFANTVYHHPALVRYKWYWRLDCDSYLLSFIHYDIFRRMEKKGYVYGYRQLARENPAFCVGIWDATKKFMEENNISAQDSMDLFVTNGDLIPRVFYSNFEIGLIDFWKSGVCQKYFDLLDRTGGFYKYRWGDHIVHSLLVGMTLPKTKIHEFKDIAYLHDTHVGLPPSFPYFSNRLWLVASAWLKRLKFLIKK